MSDDDEQMLRIAVPSDKPGGLDAARSGHFGRSPLFTIVDIVDGSIVHVMVVENEPHADGECLSAVLTLGQYLVDVVIVAGIGPKPLLHSLQAGIRVFAGGDRPDVRSAVEAFLEAELDPVGPDATCSH